MWHYSFGMAYSPLYRHFWVLHSSTRQPLLQHPTVGQEAGGKARSGWQQSGVEAEGLYELIRHGAGTI